MRVIAIESIENGICRSYGEGELLGDKEPSSGWLSGFGIKHPCIKLDSGQYIWGYQCWWAASEIFNEKFKPVL